MYSVTSSSNRLRAISKNTRLKMRSTVSTINAVVENVHLLNISDYAYTGYFAEDYTQTTLIED